MRVIKSFNQALLTRVFEAQNKRLFAITVAYLFPFDGPSVKTEVDLWKASAEQLGKENPFDMAMPKSRGEILVMGKAFAAAGKPVQGREISFSLGTISKRLYIFGDRFWKRTALGTGDISAPAFFTEMELGYKNSFGGPGFDRNPLGKGTVPVPTSNGPAIPLPNLENPEKMIGAPADRPEPANFGPIDLTWPQRMKKAGTYDAEWQKQYYPGLAADMDPTFFNTAPEDQQLREGYFSGTESFAVSGMHPARETVLGKLPGLRTRCFINQKKDDGEFFREIHTQVDTVWLFPAIEQGIIVYRGVAEVADDEGLDVLQILTAYERLSDEPKTFEHYHQALTSRLGQDAPPLLLLDERDILPPGEPSPLFALLEEAKAKEEPSPLTATLKKQADKVMAAKDEMYKKVGMTPPQLPPPADDIPMDPEAINAAMEKLNEAASKMGEYKEKVLAQAREQAEKIGLDFDALLKKAKQRARRPSLNLEANLAMLKKAGRCTPELEEKLRKAETTIHQAYRENAQYFPPPEIPAQDELDRLRDDLVERHRTGRPAIALDLAGTDLSGLNLKGIDLSNSLMESVNLAGTDLSDANLAGCVLVHTNLAGARLVRANLTGANLGDSNLSGAICTGATMKNAVLSKSDLTGANCAGADLDGANLFETILVGTDLSRTRLIKMNFYQNDLSGAKLVEADISESNFIMAKLNNADLSGATGKKPVFFKAEAEGCIFARSNFESMTVVEPGNFANCDFRRASIKKSGFTNVNLDRARFNGATLDGTLILNSTMVEADLTGVSAPGARFERVNLEGAKLRGINLDQGSLRKCRLVNADLTAGNFFRADLFRIVVGGTRFDGANFDCTILEKMVT